MGTVIASKDFNFNSVIDLMNYTYPFILGILTKVYDDIIDMKFNISEDIIQTIQSLIIVFIVLTVFGDFYLSFCFCIVAYCNSGFDNSFWKSLFPVSLILTILNISYTGPHIFLKLLAVAFVMIGVLILALTEEALFPEEVSYKKIIFRVLLLFGFAISAIIFYLDILPIPRFSVEPLIKTSILLGSNMLVSVINMSYLWYFTDI